MKSYEQTLLNLLEERKQHDNDSFPCPPDSPEKDELEILNSLGLIKLKKYIDGGFRVDILPAALIYFDKEEVVTPNQPVNITINDSTGFNIGNNNAISVKAGIDFSEAYSLIETMDSSNKEVLKELIATIQDCLENSKPMPKGKFSKAVEATSDLLPIISTIGGIIFKFFVQ